MKAVQVKICGITNEGDLEMVCDLGADVVSFIVGVPSSPRNLTPSVVKSSLVLVPKGVDELIELYEELGRDIIQIQGFSIKCFHSEGALDVLLIGAVRIGPGVEQVRIEGVKPFDAVLVDSHSSGGLLGLA